MHLPAVVVSLCDSRLLNAGDEQEPAGASNFASIVAKLASPQKRPAVSALAPAPSPLAAVTAPPAAATAAAPSTLSTRPEAAVSSSRPADAVDVLAAPRAAAAALPPAELWSEKYRPRTRKDLIGNQSHVDKMFQFLTTWFVVPRAHVQVRWRQLTAATASHLCVHAGQEHAPGERVQVGRHRGL